MVADTLLHFRIALPHSNENENAISNSLSNFSDPHLGSILLRNWKKCYLWIMSKIWLVLQTQNSTWTVSKFSSLFPKWNTLRFRPNTLSSRVICFFWWFQLKEYLLMLWLEPTTAVAPWIFALAKTDRETENPESLLPLIAMRDVSIT